MKPKLIKKKNNDIVPTPCRLQIEEESERLLKASDEAKKESEAYYPTMLTSDADASEILGRHESLRRANANITKALKQTLATSDEFGARWHDITKQKKRKHAIFATPANAGIDHAENEAAHFAKGMNLYKLLLLCFIGSFVGVIIELLWCYIRNGYFESRSGLVWGPFNLLYGAGAVALTVGLYRFRNRGSHISFLGGMLVGSAVEYLCSWGQEVLIGSRSWDYSGMPLNINGRICLLYSIFWGALGVLWIKNLYPRVAKLILKIPNNIGRILTWCATVFLIANSIVSLLAVMRWSQRVDGITEVGNFLWQFFDTRFPDERMARIYANMKFGK